MKYIFTFFLSFAFFLQGVHADIVYTGVKDHAPVLKGISLYGTTASGYFAPPGAGIILHGYHFGDIAGNVLFAETASTIISWRDDQIVLLIPQVSALEADTHTITIVSHNGLTSEYPYTLRLPIAGSNDPLAPFQPYLEVHQIGDLWNGKDAKREVNIALIGDGMNMRLEDIRDSLWVNPKEQKGQTGKDDDKNGYKDDIYGWNFLSSSPKVDTLKASDTTYAGIIGAKRNNAISLAGITDHVRFMNLVACTSSTCPKEALATAITYATDNGANIILIPSEQFSTLLTLSTLRKEIDAAYKKGVLIVASAGLNGYDAKAKWGDKYQETFAKILLVGASDEERKPINTPLKDLVSVYSYSKVVPKAFQSGLEGDFFADAGDGEGVSASMVAGISAYIFSRYPEVNAQKYIPLIQDSSNEKVIHIRKLLLNL